MWSPFCAAVPADWLELHLKPDLDNIKWSNKEPRDRP